MRNQAVVVLCRTFIFAGMRSKVKRKRGMQPIKRYEHGGPHDLPLLNNPENTDMLLQRLQGYGESAERDSEVGEALRAGRDRSVDFMTRFYQSPYYKNIVGGREMMYSDQGFEDSPEGERIRKMRVISNPKINSLGRYMSRNFDVSKKANLGTLADLRNPAGLIEINTGDDYPKAMYDPYLYTHEMSHASGDPAQQAMYMDGILYSAAGMQSYDRHMLEGNPSRPYISEYGFNTTRSPVHRSEGQSIDEALTREKEKMARDYEELGGRYREPLPDPGIPVTRDAYRLDNLKLEYLASNKNQNLKGGKKKLRYLQNPTELAARMRAVTHKLQDEGLMDQDDFDLTYDKLYRAYKNGDRQAEEILTAMGVVSLIPEEKSGKTSYEDFSSEPLHNYSANWSGKRETIGDVAREKYNRYLRGKI